MLEVPTRLRSMIVDEVGEEEMLNYLTTQGFRTLYQNGLDKVVAGHLSYDEVQRVCRAQ